MWGFHIKWALANCPSLEAKQEIEVQIIPLSSLMTVIRCLMITSLALRTYQTLPEVHAAVKGISNNLWEEEFIADAQYSVRN